MKEPEVDDAVQLFHAISCTRFKGYVERAHTSPSVLPDNQSVAGVLLNILSRFQNKIFRVLQEYLSLCFNGVLSTDFRGINLNLDILFHTGSASGL